MIPYTYIETEKEHEDLVRAQFIMYEIRKYLRSDDEETA